jgi:hypothetical protein
MITLDNGEILLAHMDRDDRKLILINTNGEVEWERSYASLLDGTLKLMQISRLIFILNEQTLSNNRVITIYEVIPEKGELEKVFIGGSRRANAGYTWYHYNDTGEMVVNIGGSSLVGLNLAFSGVEQ